MRNFLLGTGTGASLVLVGLGVNSLVFAQQYHDSYVGDPDMLLSGGTPDPTTNFKLEKERPDLEWDYNKVMSEAYDMLSVESITPISSFGRLDVASVCIDPFPANNDNHAIYSVNIRLSPGARERLGSSLAEKDNEEVAIRILGQPINYFFVDGAKARHFAAGKEDPHLADEADIFFTFTRSATYYTLILISSLTGQAEIASCISEFDIESMPGYQTHKKNWQDMAARVARGESWMLPVN